MLGFYLKILDFLKYRSILNQNSIEISLRLSWRKLLTFICIILIISLLIFCKSKMKNNTIFIALVLSCIILLSYGQHCCIKNTVTVQGQGENRIKPNIAIIYAYLTVEGNTASSALNSVDDRVKAITNALKSAGVS